MIGLSEILNLTNSDTGDDYEFMAGGQFDFYQAGSLGYSAFNLPSPDLRSFFIAQAGNLSGAIIGLNEDFAEYVLMPMIIAINQPDYDTSLNMLIDGVNAATNITFSKPKNSNRDNRFGRIDGNGFANLQRGDYTSLKEFLAEMRNDSYAENIAEDIGKMYGGVVGQALAGMLYDGIVNGRFNAVNVAEAMYQNMKSTMTSLAVQNTLSALGTTISPIGVAAAASLINALVTEVFELAVGLDNHFGFGGDLNAVVGNTAFYDRPMSFGEFMQDTFSGWFGIPDVTIAQTDYNGTLTGARVGKQLYGYKMEQTFNDALHGRAGKKTLTPLDPVMQNLQKFAEAHLEKIKSDLSWTSNLQLDSLGRLNFNINTRTTLENLGFSTQLTDSVFNAAEQIANAYIDQAIAFNLNMFNVSPTGASESGHSNTNTTAENTYSGSDAWAATATKLASIMNSGHGGLGVSVDKHGNFSFSNTPAGNMVEAMGLIGFGGAKMDYGLAMRVAAELAKQKTAIEAQRAEAAKGTHKDSYGQTTRGWNDHSNGFGYTTKNGGLNRDKNGRRTHASERTGLGQKSRGQKSRERQGNKNGRR